MTQEQEKIEQLTADRRKLVWEAERLRAEVVQLKRQVATLTDRLADEAENIAFLQKCLEERPLPEHGDADEWPAL